MTQDIATALIHHPYRPPSEFEALQPGVFKASTVFFPNVAALEAREWRDKSGYTYGLHGTPTTFILEERIASLEGGLQCLLVPSGLAAIACVSLSLLKTGDEVLIPDNVYGPSKTLAAGELAALGVSFRVYDAMNPASLEAALSPRTRLVWLEAAGSVTMEFPDLPRLAGICRARGVTTALDNTWGAGLAFAPFDLVGDGTGVDISVHALTKYPSGGGDVLMGSIVTRDEGVHMRIKMTHMRLGLGVGANDAEAVLRALPSVALRYRAQDQAARELATWLGSRAEIAQVLHPAVAGSPGHEHWQALCGSRGGLAAGIFSIVFDAAYSREQVNAFCDALRLFRIGYSWGGPISLVVPYDIDSMRDASVAPWPHAGRLVRLCIGLEGVEDLRLDLLRALATLAPAN
ncbi:PLP-dependent transferase [Xylophilus sp. GOD-11R]|uniref:PLP-dependent transferase n=1 Tax=Xylophilus sp. GOD-11R TaxID=3089814 RepID=UPI00298CD2DB|nr:PLP-dependent transferase [Xylophilus sp. GOD-11R]WPB59097.1 PLP-dependent transferase [Xylophilus sp. GOD-11R]